MQKLFPRLTILPVLFAALALGSANLYAIQVQVATSLPSPQKVGTPITWTVTASDPNPGLLNYRFAVSAGGPSTTISDYTQANTFTWTPSVREGLYQMQVTVRNNSTQQTQAVTVPFLITSRVTGTQPVVSSTAHPLVALFSAPACPAGSAMRVRFMLVGNNFSDVTSLRPCTPNFSMNMYVGGMRPNSNYQMRSEIISGTGATFGSWIPFTTGSPGIVIPSVSLPVPATTSDDLTDHVLLLDFLSFNSTQNATPAAFDLQGNLLWYYNTASLPLQTGFLMTRPIAGGTFLVFSNGANSANSVIQQQLLQEIDLAGNVLRQTNASRVSEQLAAMGLQSSCTVGGQVCAGGFFHHYAIRLSNGHTLVLMDIEKIEPPGTQPNNTPGGTGVLDVIGDLVVELDQNFQVVWYWNAFDHLDVTRPAVLNETCGTPATGGCGPLFLTTSTANDWLHTNALDVRSDGALIISIRHQDWVIKVDYNNGTNPSGNLLWKLGNQGNFGINSTDPWPWFSHQHDAGFESNGVFTVFDNGNTRVAQNPGITENSRGMVLNVDETNMVATPVLSQSLGVYSFALGSAQLLRNGNYHFLAGILQPGPTSNSYELSPSGTTGFEFVGSYAAYRSFRMPNLYTPPTT